jgi:hypothetical protein
MEHRQPLFLLPHPAFHRSIGIMRLEIRVASMRPHSALHDAVAEGNESLKHREQQAFRASIEFSPKEAQQKTTHPSDNTGLYDEELQAPCLLSSLPLKRTDSHEKKSYWYL